MSFFSIPQSSAEGQLTGTSREQIGPLGRVNEEDNYHEGADTVLGRWYSRLNSPPPATLQQSEQRAGHELEGTALLQLARSSVADSIFQDRRLFTAEPTGPLNPNGPDFDPKVWARVIYNIHREELPEQVQPGVGVAFNNLNVHGFGSATDFQSTVGNIFLRALSLPSKFAGKSGTKTQILQGVEGVLSSGEMLCVLGPPGSGSSTFLKTLAGETGGLVVDDASHLNYQGLTPKEITTRYRGEAIYSAEVDAHFPLLTVGDTLYFAALTRAPRQLPQGVSRRAYAEHLRDVIMAVFGISHTINTRVGDNYIRGVSGGERKRVSIAEAVLSDAPLQCWDNSTRGLDSANAIEFCKVLRTQSDVFNTASAVAIYQAPQAAYDLFDKVILLYEGREIFFGATSAAQRYFEDLGFLCPESQTTPDFLTSMTSPSERIVRPGFENRVPRTSDDFAAAWKKSTLRQGLVQEIAEFEQRYSFNGQESQAFATWRQSQKAKSQDSKSPYTISYAQQISLCLWRGWKLLLADPSNTIIQLIANFVQFLIVGSVYYNLQMTSDSLSPRAYAIFVAILLNAFASILEILTLYAKRTIVEKHKRYAMYHPSAEAIAAMIMDLPYKVVNSIVVSVTVYFMANLNRSAGPFFFFLLISFTTTLTMSMLFRFMGSATKTESQALAPTTVLLLGIIMYSGLAIPEPYMLGWSKWIKYINPAAYAFESLMINELDGRVFSCTAPVPVGPEYPATDLFARDCAVAGGVAGSSVVEGTRHLIEGYDFKPDWKWINFAIILAFLVFFMGCTLVTSEIVAPAKSKGEILVFQRGHAPQELAKRGKKGDEETGASSGGGAGVEKLENKSSASTVTNTHTSILHWRNVCYDVQIKGDTRRILDHVDGWVKPGTLTALMGTSGAGKTTLLDTLASRITMGVISGDIFVDAKIRDMSFQRKTGYVQQQDLHLSTATVREALTFSAFLRQPASTSHREKLRYVDEVIDLLEMYEYRDAVIGELGEGLNVEQRKRLSIGVELAAKPELLVFLDEPTSGLDSQTSWSICNLMEKLVKHGQAILCTIHQPSAMLFQRFDRLLLLAKGGRTVYLGDIGRNSSILIDYFVSHGADAPKPGENPAEWMLKLSGQAAPGTKNNIDWPQTWLDSVEKQNVQAELDRLEKSGLALAKGSQSLKDSRQDFAAPMMQQIFLVTKRVFEQYWRSPGYIYSKAFLCIVSALFIGFSFFQAPRTQQGIRNQMFGVFGLLALYLQLVEQIVPFFVTQRSLFEVRERPSKTYSWKAFMVANIIVEIPWNSLMSVIMFLCWWYPIGLNKNAEINGSGDSRATLAWLFIWSYMLLASTFAHLMIAGISSSQNACSLSNLLGFMTLAFCGITAPPQSLPGFWMFMYRVNPFTYLVEGTLGVGLGRSPMSCDNNELLRFQPGSDGNSTTCGDYLATYLNMAGGNLLNPGATTDCQYCPVVDTDDFLAYLGISYSRRWRDLGIVWVFIVFNAVGAVFLYWLLRVPKGGKKVDKPETAAGEGTSVAKDGLESPDGSAGGEEKEQAQ